jgi:hypothetical protein
VDRLLDLCSSPGGGSVKYKPVKIFLSLTAAEVIGVTYYLTRTERPAGAGKFCVLAIYHGSGSYFYYNFSVSVANSWQKISAKSAKNLAAQITFLWYCLKQNSGQFKKN